MQPKSYIPMESVPGSPGFTDSDTDHCQLAFDNQDEISQVIQPLINNENQDTNSLSKTAASGQGLEHSTSYFEMGHF